MWGDDHMYFRHQRMEDDLKFRPEWEPYVPVFEVFGDNMSENVSLINEIGSEIVSKVVSNCPFASFFQ